MQRHMGLPVRCATCATLFVRGTDEASAPVRSRIEARGRGQER